MKLVDAQLIQDVFMREALWSDGHGAKDSFWGAGMLYYAITYMLRAKVAVCLGSGGGFVPRCMRQAQRDLDIAESSQTILIDANNGKWGVTNWVPEGSFFRQAFPDVQVWLCDTDSAYERLCDTSLTISYLHIDADHDYGQVRRDFDNYNRLLTPCGIITLHDTTTVCGVPRLVEEIRSNGEWDLLNMTDIGAGLAMVRRK